MSPLEALRANPFVMAPMAGITDHAFRTFMRKLDSSVVVTELVSATGIEYKSQKTLDLMSFDEVQRPIGIQLFGEDAETIARAARFAQEQGCDFVDLNFGCPVPKVVKKGAGSAMLKDPLALREVLRKTKSALDIPLTIKIRTGWDAQTRNAIEVCNIAHDEGIEWVAIHGRTRAQAYTGLADWEFISEVKAKTKIPILGNGDIVSPEQAVQRLKESGCDGIMIGRGCLKNPYIFKDALALWKGEALQMGGRNYVSLFEGLKTEIVAHCDEHITGIQLRKFAAWFSTGYAGAAQFRKSLFQSKNNEEIMTLATDFFAGIGGMEQENANNEGFLMGGHG